jgi:stearoyl-CoA desaturase (delta-9 desaturase)
MHVACLSVLWVGWSWPAVATAFLMYVARAFGLTAFYHRYFSHRAFKTSRWFQFLGGALGSAAVQRGPIWWAAHHREHHRLADREGDLHSPHQHGFWWSHMGWFMTRESFVTNERRVRDWLKFPELRFLDRYDIVVPLLYGAGMYGWGEAWRWAAPTSGVTGWQMLVWGFLISTIFLYHVTYAINSVAHVCGSRRFATKDHSRNNLWLALLTLGEGWHNNHHYYPASARQGFFWWEIDVTYYILVVLSWFRLVWELKPVPARILVEGRQGPPVATAATD